MSTVTANDKVLADRPLKVLIAGAGIGGLTAALAFRQQGHEVTIFERSALSTETGAALHLAPNCNGLLRKLGVYAEEFGANLCLGVREFGSDGRPHFDIDTSGSNALWQYDWLLSHRVHLHEALKAAAIGVDGKGVPAILKTRSRVVAVDTASATITLEDGQKFTGDLVIGADGVGSMTRKFIPGGADVEAFDSGKSAYRFLIPAEKLRDDPITAPLLQKDGQLTMWVGKDRRLIMYPCAHNTLFNYVAIHDSVLTQTSGQDWNERGSKDGLIDVYKEFELRVGAMLQHVDPDSLKVWTLLDMEKLPTWICGKLVLIGDAAHPFLPHQGQGGGVAIEDAVSLSIVLPLGTRPDEIPERLALYEKIRYDRAHRIQHYTRLAGEDLKPGDRGRFNVNEYRDYNLGHDEWHNSLHAFKKFLWAKDPPRWRQPIGFSPMTGPRQPYPGNRIPLESSKFTRRSIRFKTSRTYLQTLFPSPTFSFTSPGTVAEATFRVDTLENLGWLGGGGYSLIGLYIHGVQYTKLDGNKIYGTYIPVLFESLADPIITGREELGVPKLFCDIQVRDSSAGSQVVCSWRGITFATLKWVDLAEGDHATNGTSTSRDANPHAPPIPDEEGELVYRYIPAVGKPGEADASYPVFIPYKGSSIASKTTRTLKAKMSKIDFEPRDWESLPTLHNIVQTFSEVPIDKILEAKVEEGLGVSDLSHAERIE